MMDKKNTYIKQHVYEFSLSITRFVYGVKLYDRSVIEI